MAATGKAITNHPEMAKDVAEASVRYFWMLGAAVVVLLLWRHGQMPWHREPRLKVVPASHTVVTTPTQGGSRVADESISLS